MQDRFKFRIFDKKLNKMANWGDNPYHNMEIVNIICSNNPEFNSDNRFHLMQCTGLRDKNSKLIFEGDIIKLYGKNYKVIFEKRAAYFGLFISKNETYRLNDIHTLTSEIEIIGNIYENPELLEGNQC